MSVVRKTPPIVVDLNGTNAKGEPTYAGYTIEEAMKIATESSSPEAMNWLRLWYRGDLMTMNSTPENF